MPSNFNSDWKLCTAEFLIIYSLVSHGSIQWKMTQHVSKPLITYQRFWYITVIAAIVTCRPKNSMVLWRSNELQIFLFECWIARSERVERIPRVALNGSLNKSRSFRPFLLVRRGYWARKFVLALSTAELQHVVFFIFFLFYLLNKMAYCW